MKKTVLKLCSLLLVGAALPLTACAAHQEMTTGAPVKAMNGIMVDDRGMTLYTFDKDPVGGGKSVCNGPCATNWPPLEAAPGATATGPFSIVTRDDGSRQWAYEGKPLYLWIRDEQPGDMTGDNFKGVWHVVEYDGMAGGKMERGSSSRGGY